MGAPVRIAGQTRALPRYLNPDLSLNRAAIDQAAWAWAEARIASAGQPRAYRVGQKLWPMRVRTIQELRLEAVERFEGIAKGMQASERHFRRIDAAAART